MTVQPLSSKPAGVPSPRETSSAKLGATDPYNSDDSTTTTKKQSWWERLKSNLYYMFTDPIGFFTGKDPNTDGTFTLGAGSFFVPTLLVGATMAMRCMREEVFGPVLPIAPAAADDA